MKKYLQVIIPMLFIAGAVYAGPTNLWEYFSASHESLPSFLERAKLADSIGIEDYQGTIEQNSKILNFLLGLQNEEELVLGATLPIAGATYNLAGAGVSGSATSITLQSLTIPQTGQKIADADLSPTFYVTLEPGNRTRQEIASCTTVTQNSGGTATLSGCSRGLSPITPYTASSTLQFPHAGGSHVIFSDPPQLFNLFSAKDNTETITGQWIFNILPQSSVAPTTTDQFVNKAYADAIANQGAATSTEATGGISELATQIEMASSTDNGVDKPLVLQAKYATSTPPASNAYAQDLWVPISENDGKLNINWFDLTDNETWSFAHSTTTEWFEVTGRTKLANATSTGTINTAELGFDGGDVMTKWPFFNAYASSSDFLIAANRYAWQSVTVPALGVSDAIKVRANFFVNGNAANCPGISIRFDSATSTLFPNDTSAATGIRIYHAETTLQNFNSASKNMLNHATTSSGSGSADVQTLRMEMATSTINTSDGVVVDIASEAAAGTCYIFGNTFSVDVIRNGYHP